MTLIAKIVLLLWFPISLWIFRKNPPRKAIIITAIVGTLFLPQRVFFRLPLIPDYDSNTAVVYGILVGLLIYDPKWVTRLKPWWLDVPILIWCMSAFIASWRNDLGMYDGVTETLRSVWLYAFPYFIGRVYFNNLDSIKKLAVAIVKSALIYMPFCLWEGLMSPQLHKMIYGYFPHVSGLRQAMRYGGYRPNVFMSHGLAVGLWIMTATLIAVWLWQSKAVREIWGFDMIYVVPVLVFLLIWCRSTGAILYFFYGLLILAFVKWGKSALPFLLLIAAIIIYLFVNIEGIFNKVPLLQLMSSVMPPDRLQSFEFRLDEETILVAKAREKFWFGWGGWGRNRVFEENFYGIFEDISITDSLWILAFGTRGVIATISLYASMLLPAVLFQFFCYPVRTWLQPKIAPASVFAVLLPLLMLDNLFNDHLTIVPWVMCGALTSIILSPKGKLAKIYSEDKLNSGYLSKIPDTITQR